MVCHLPWTKNPNVSIYIYIYTPYIRILWYIVQHGSPFVARSTRTLQNWTSKLSHGLIILWCLKTKKNIVSAITGNMISHSSLHQKPDVQSLPAGHRSFFFFFGLWWMAGEKNGRIQSPLLQAKSSSVEVAHQHQLLGASASWFKIR